MSNVTVSMKMSPKQAGALYVKCMRLEDELEKLTAEVASYQEQLRNEYDKREALEQERDELAVVYEQLYEAAKGLSFGVDWNSGTHAIEHGYRQKLLDAVENHGNKTLLAKRDLEMKEKGVEELRGSTGFWNLSNCKMRTYVRSFEKYLREQREQLTKQAEGE